MVKTTIIPLKPFKVEIEMPPGVTVSEMKQYIEEAVQGWCGGLRPESPLCDIERDHVRVTAMHKRKRPKKAKTS